MPVLYHSTAVFVQRLLCEDDSGGRLYLAARVRGIVDGFNMSTRMNRYENSSC
jgi:hypothetical protein